jgi:hypothetical protein
MRAHWVIPILIFVVLFPTSLIASSRGQPVQITVGQSSITMSMHLLLQENLTSLPLINTSLTEANSSGVLQPILEPINSSINGLVPSARVTDLQLQAQTLNASGTWLLKENYTVTVVGANMNVGSSIRSNLAFVAMNVSQSLILDNNELNAVGSEYLLGPLNAMNPSTTVYYIDGHQTLSAVIPGETTKLFWLLDLSWVPSISSWPETQDLLKQTTTWSLDQGFPRYNLTLGRKSPEGPLIGVYMATYYPTFSISVPANAWINGNTISFDVPVSSETTMPIIIAVSLGTLVAVSLWDWRLSRALRFRRKKKQDR